MEKQRNIPWELVVMYVRGELPEERRPEWEAFLETEPDFAKHTETMRGIAAELPTVRRLTPDELAERYERLSARFKRRRPMRRIAAWSGGVAAAAILAFMAITVFTRHPVEGEFSPDALVHSEKQKIELITVSGERIEIDPALVQAFPNAIMDEGTLHILGEEVSGLATAQNTLRVPNGGFLKAELPDGTKIYINSASQLSFPAAFSDDKREVTLLGEAYFEVTADERRPFIVHTPRQEVRVLGTSFNVSSYADETEESVVLVSGKLVLSADSGEQTLEPGYRALLAGGTAGFTVEKVNTNLYTGWKDGIFRFNRMPLEKIMVTLSRWYDVDIRFDDDAARSLHFTGAIEKEWPLSRALEMINASAPVGFSTDHEAVVVTRKAK